MKPTLTTCLRVIAGLLLAAPALPALAQDYPNLEDYAREKLDTRAAWYQGCMKVKDLPPPQEDAPAAARVESLGECDALDLYYQAQDDAAASQGDWDRVRACAVTNNDHAVLTMLYANGLGVKFNPGLALQHACSGNGMNIDPRVVAQAMLEVQRAGRPPRPPYDICDAAVAPRAQIRCGQLSEAQSDAEDARELGELSRNWSAAQKAALERLHQAAMAYADAWGEESDDESLAEDGTLPDPMASGRVRQKALFMSDIENAEDGQLPQYTAAQSAALERRLAQSLREALSPDGQRPDARHPEGTKEGDADPAPEDLRNTQRAWLAYRDAWVAYGKARYPKVPAHAWKAWLTERRIQQLEGDDAGDE